jgi:hypothetical protein
MRIAFAHLHADSELSLHLLRKNEPLNTGVIVKAFAAVDCKNWGLGGDKL